MDVVQSLSFCSGLVAMRDIRTASVGAGSYRGVARMHRMLSLLSK